MQHDTSPHDVMIGGKNRFWVKVFLTEALRFFEGAAARVVARGTGKDAVMAPEMVAYGTRFGFCFEAHALGAFTTSSTTSTPDASSRTWPTSMLNSACGARR